jgi:hypothetical protein
MKTKRETKCGEANGSYLAQWIKKKEEQELGPGEFILKVKHMTLRVW